MMKYRWIVSVRGKGTFPLDMLRYENCWPATDTDVLEILALERSSGKNPTNAVITLHKNSETAESEQAWHPKKWQSFGWEIISIACEGLVKKQTRKK